MSLIKIDNGVFYIDIVEQDGLSTSIRRNAIKRLKYNEISDTVVLVIVADDTREFFYLDVENPETLGESFLSGEELLVYIGSLLGIRSVDAHYVWHQSVTGNKSYELVQNLNGTYSITNYGSGGSAVDVNVGNVQVLRLDGVDDYVQTQDISSNLVTITMKAYDVVLNPDTALFSTTANSDLRCFIWNALGDKLTFRYKNGLSAFVNVFFDTVIIDTLDLVILIDIPNAEITVNGELKAVPDGFFMTELNAINIGAGTSYNSLDAKLTLFEIDNFSRYYFQAQQGTVIKDYSGNGNDGTLINANLEVAWGTKSDSASPERYNRGFNKVNVTEMAGTSAILASVDGSNVGSELVTTGGWTAGTGWSETSLIFACDGSQVANSDILKAILTLAEYNSIEIEVLTYSAGDLTILTGSGTSQAVNTSIGKTNYFGLTAGSTDLVLRADLDFIGSFKISCKEVTNIPAYGEWKGLMSKAVSGLRYAIPFINNANTGYDDSNIGNRYVFLWWTDNKVYLLKKTASSSTILFSSINTFLDSSVDYEYYITRNESVDEFVTGGIGTFATYIRGGIYLEWTLVPADSGNNPVLENTHTITKFITSQQEVNNSLSQLSFNDVLFDMGKFVDDSGATNVRYDLGIDSINDVNGIPLQYKPRCVTPSEELFQNQDDATLNTALDEHAALAVLKYPLKFDYTTIIGIDRTGIPTTDFDLEIGVDCVTKMRVKS